MQGKIELVKEHLRLTRIHSCLITAFIPIFGALSVKGVNKLLLPDIMALFTIGILVHVFGFVLNEFVDMDMDRKSPHLTKKPLVSGTVSKRNALAISLLSLAASLILCALYFRNFTALMILAGALCFGGLYDILGKKMPGSDLLLGGWAFGFCLFGAAAVTLSFTPFTYLIGALIFLRVMFENGVLGDLKDVEQEAQNGVRTMPILLGVKLSKGRLHVTRNFKFYAYALEITFIMLVLVSIAFFNGNLIVIAFAMLFAAAMLFTMQFLSSQKYDREKLKRIMGRHEAVALSFLALILFVFFGPIGALLMLIAISWFGLSVRMLYGFSPNI